MTLDDFLNEKRDEIKAASSCRWFEIAIEELITEAYMEGYNCATEIAVKAIKGEA